MSGVIRIPNVLRTSQREPSATQRAFLTQLVYDLARRPLTAWAKALRSRRTQTTMPVETVSVFSPAAPRTRSARWRSEAQRAAYGSSARLRSDGQPFANCRVRPPKL